MIAGVFFMSLLTASLASIMIEKETKEESDKTLEEMKNGTDLIYQGVLIYENLLGIPDLLKRNVDNLWNICRKKLIILFF